MAMETGDLSGERSKPATRFGRDADIWETAGENTEGARQLPLSPTDPHTAQPRPYFSSARQKYQKPRTREKIAQKVQDIQIQCGGLCDSMRIFRMNSI